MAKTAKKTLKTKTPAKRMSQSVAVRRVHARYDAAQTTTENTRHWANADCLSPNAALSPEIRRTLRSRARYEFANNSYCMGIVKTLANDTIGTGARLQVVTDNEDANDKVEEAFAEWADEIKLSRKLRTMRMSRAVDGEAFGILGRNLNLSSRIKLDLSLIEADQIATPFGKNSYDSDAIDGISLDKYGNTESYYVLDIHPGAGTGTSYLENFSTIKAKDMIHLFDLERPGQHRGVPEITPALPLFAQLRRYTLAVIAAAETAADFAAVLYTDSPASGEPTSAMPFDIVDLEKRMATVLPEGWKLGQIDATQPATTYKEFKNEILNEIARCLSIPFNVAACNSSQYNYASGRLDHQTYYRSIKVYQKEFENIALSKIFRAWLNEAVLISDLVPVEWRMNPPKISWFWDGREHVDPQKEANAQYTRVHESLTSNLAIEYAQQGRDWRVELRQKAKELELMKQLGLSIPQKPLAIKETEDEAV